MKIMIIGATGGTGRCLVDQALAAGHTVTAPARDPSRLGPARAGLTTLRCDVLDEVALTRAMPGHDAVFVCLGAPALRRSTIRERGTANVIAAMRDAGVRRLVALSVLGAGASRSTLPFFVRYVLAPTYLRWPFADHEGQERAVRASGLDWTLVRPPFLTDGEATGDFAHGFTSVGGLTLKIARADVAAFMLRTLESGTYVREAPAVSC